MQRTECIEANENIESFPIRLRSSLPKFFKISSILWLMCTIRILYCGGNINELQKMSDMSKQMLNTFVTPALKVSNASYTSV